jgi:hypothetical protein
MSLLYRQPSLAKEVPVQPANETADTVEEQEEEEMMIAASLNDIEGAESQVYVYAEE